MAAAIENPIINAPYAEPSQHWELDTNGQPTGAKLQGRRPNEMFMPVARPRKGSKHAYFAGTATGKPKGPDPEAYS